MATYKYFKEEKVRKLLFAYYKEETSTRQVMAALEAEIKQRLEQDYIAIVAQEDIADLPEIDKAKIAKGVNLIHAFTKEAIANNKVNKGKDKECK